MDLRTLLRVLVRRWYVVLPILVITAGAGQQLTKSIKPSYEASGSMILLSPAVRTTPGVVEPELRNPYTDLTPALRTTAIAVQRVINEGTASRKLRDQGLQVSFDVAVDDNAPILTLTTTADKPEQATLAVASLATVLSDELQTMQNTAGAPVDRQITAANLTTAQGASKKNADFYRALATIAAVGLAAAIVGALAIESWFSSPNRRRRLAKRSESAAAWENFAVIGAPPGTPEQVSVSIEDWLLATNRRRHREAETIGANGGPGDQAETIEADGAPGDEAAPDAPTEPVVDVAAGNGAATWPIKDNGTTHTQQGAPSATDADG